MNCTFRSSTGFVELDKTTSRHVSLAAYNFLPTASPLPNDGHAASLYHTPSASVFSTLDSFLCKAQVTGNI